VQDVACQNEAYETHTLLSLPQSQKLVFLVDRSMTPASEVRRRACIIKQPECCWQLPCILISLAVLVTVKFLAASVIIDHSCARVCVQSRGMLREVGRDLQRRVRTNSPFNPKQPVQWNAAQQLIVAFEMHWDAVVGIDWSRPLVHDGRVVLEARSVVKRIFRSVRRR